MSLKVNILASYASQLYVTLIGIVMVPFYVKYMGAEAYGLVGFFAMLQAWFQLLDMGLTPTMARETARFQGGGTDALSLRRLLRALEGIFIGVAVAGAIVLTAGAPWIANNWLKVQQLPIIEVERAIMLMGLIVAFRWVSGLYRGAVNGFERVVWLSSFNAVVATLRFVVVIPLFVFVGSSPTHFFAFQLLIALLELLTLVAMTYRIMPAIVEPVPERGRWNWTPLRGVLKFSLGVAFTSSVWVLVTQTDKLILSKLLSLSDYAHFSLAVLVAGGILLLTGPISSAVVPRLARLAAATDERALIATYRSATRLVVVIAVPASLVLGFFAESVLFVWTGDVTLSHKAAPVLALYAAGNGILTLAAFPYYLQFAKGDLRLHVIGNALFLLFLIPSIIWAVNNYGAVGAGYAWVIANIIYFVAWIPLVHARFSRGLHFKWLCIDIAALCATPIVLITLANSFVDWPSARVPLATGLMAIGFALIGITLLACKVLDRVNAR